jgi:hypothetical protein
MWPEKWVPASACVCGVACVRVLVLFRICAVQRAVFGFSCVFQRPVASAFWRACPPSLRAVAVFGPQSSFRAVPGQERWDANVHCRNWLVLCLPIQNHPPPEDLLW